MPKYKVELTITLEYELPSPSEDPKFFFEEHLCVDNLVNQLHQEVEETNAKGFCATCSRSSVKYLGEAIGG